MRGTISFAIAIAFGSIACIDSTTGPGPAERMVSRSPLDQMVLAGTAAPISPSVQVVDAGGVPVPNVKVTFSVLSGDGAVTGAEQTTNEKGVATAASWTIGGYGRQQIVAMSEGLPTIALTSIGIGPPEGALGFEITDPVGDCQRCTPRMVIDAVAIRGDFKLDSLIVTVTFNEPISDSMKNWIVDLKLDTDGNLDTPIWEDDYGFENRLLYSSESDQAQVQQKGHVRNVTHTLDSNTITFHIPMWTLGYDVGSFLLTATVSAYNEESGVAFDLVPDGDPATVHAVP